MSTAQITAPWAPVRTSTSLAALTRYEMRRYVSNPLFGLGVVLTAVSCYVFLHRTLTDPGGLPGYPATFLGVFGIAIGFRLSQSLTSVADALDVAPASPRLRTIAMCLTALVPFSVGVVTLFAVQAYQHPAGSWTYGTFSSSDRFAILASELAVSALGGPLLGIAVARWVRSFWVLPALLIFVYVWVSLANALTVKHESSFAFVLLRMLTPYAYFLSHHPGSLGIETWRGSPWFFLGWQLCLCALCVTAALLRDATAAFRQHLLAAVIVITAIAVAMYVLAATGGLGHAVILNPDGSVQPL
jgi:hypothetical protein